MAKRILIVVVAATLALGGCQTALLPAQSESFSSGEYFIRTELIFGLSKNSGDLISEGEWEKFVAGYIVPKFPLGFTVIDAIGHYLSKTNREIRERSKLVLIVYHGSSEAEAAIEQIRADYRQLFDQEAVLRFSVPVRHQVKQRH
jgi:hypothetical protein